MNIASAKSALLPPQRGQSTVEFMLMVPIIFSMLFFCIQMGLYFSTIHYSNYAAHVTARAQQGNFNDTYSNIGKVSDLILTGAVWGTASVTSLSDGGQYTGVSVSLTNFEQLVPFPFITNLMPDLKLNTQVYLGPNECLYEYKADPSRPDYQYDNNVPRSSCYR